MAGIWKIISGWLDPVVAAKVHFTNNKADMEEYIAPTQLLRELEGQEEWTYQYAEPVPGENEKLDDTKTRDELLAARELLYREFEEATLQWIADADAGNGPGDWTAKRDDIANRLREDYWVVDPYIRARSLYDRTGILGPGGKLDFYPAPAGAPEQAAVTAETEDGVAPGDVAAPEAAEAAAETKEKETTHPSGEPEKSADDVD